MCVDMPLPCRNSAPSEAMRSSERRQSSYSGTPAPAASTAAASPASATAAVRRIFSAS
jgi:hypothetical protein